MNHPIQPLIEEPDGRLRFKENAIVRYLLDHGGIDLNKIAALDFSQDDREQFAQLIGYSLDGAASLSYMSDEVLSAAEAMHKEGVLEHEARINVLRKKLSRTKAALRKGVAELFDMHPDDLG